MLEKKFFIINWIYTNDIGNILWEKKSKIVLIIKISFDIEMDRYNFKIFFKGQKWLIFNKNKEEENKQRFLIQKIERTFDEKSLNERVYWRWWIL